MSASSYNDGLSVNGNFAFGSGLSIENTNAGGKKWAILSGGSSSAGGIGSLSFYNDTGGQYRMTLAPGGNLGIGTATPVNKLTVQSDAGMSISMTTSSVAGPFFSSQETMSIDYNLTGDYAEIMSVHDGQIFKNLVFNLVDKFGIGTTAPATKLDVAGTVTATAFSGNGAGLTGVSATSTTRTPLQIALLKWSDNVKEAASFSVGNTPQAVCFDGSSIWVANKGDHTVTKLNASTGAFIGTYTVGLNPYGVCFDGSSIWVTARASSNVTTLNAATGASIGTYSTGPGAEGICFNGRYVWVTNFGDNTVTQLHASTGLVAGTFNVGQAPRGICFDGSSLWVTHYGGNNVMKFNPNTGAVIGTYSVGTQPLGICFDGASIWVANETSENVTKLNASTGAVIGTYYLGTSATGICFDGSSIWVANGVSVAKLNASTGAPIYFHATSAGSYGVSFDRANIWVTNSGANTVTKF